MGKRGSVRGRWCNSVAVALALAIAACGGGSGGNDRSGAGGTGDASGTGGTGDTGGTGGPGGPGGTGGTGSTPATGWTVLVYMAADNDLEQFAVQDLKEMAAAGTGAGFKIVVQADRAAGYSAEPVLNMANWTTAKRLQVGNGSVTELADLGEIDMASASSLAEFVRWGITAHPAAKYMLVLWDHGGGWTGFGADFMPSVGNVQHNWMALPSISSGIATGLQQAGVSKLDVIGFDACLMATVEVAESMKAYGRYLLASEELEPGHGWDYRAMNGAAALDGVSLSKKIADGFKAQADSFGRGASITLSVVDLGQLAPIEAAMSSLAAHYGTATAMSPVVAAVAQQRASVLAFGADPDPARATNLVDARGLLAPLTLLGSDAAALEAAISGAVLYQVKGTATASATGLSIYLPPASLYYEANYDSLPGMDAWRSFVKAYYAAAATATAPTFASGAYNATSPAVYLDGLLTPGSLSTASTATLVYGLPGNSGDAWVFGESGATASTESDGDHIRAEWDYSFLRLTQTAPVAHHEFGYLAVRQVDANTGAAIVPFNYYEPGLQSARPVMRQVVFELSSGAVLNDAYFLVSTSGQVGELAPVAGSTLRAVVAHLPNAGTQQTEWVEFSASGGFDASQFISYDFVSLNPGAAFFSGLRVANAAGSGDWIATSVTTPPVRPQ